jgi:hypothetical protein
MTNFNGIQVDINTQSIAHTPSNWALVPVKGKAPYTDRWESKTFSRKAIAADLRHGKATGFGLKTGPVSGGIIAIDCDGEWGHQRLEEVLRGEIPKTVSFTSGKPGRAQYLFSVAEHHWDSLKTTKENAPKEIPLDGDGKRQGLEFRWAGAQSVLPPSIHPDTGKPYQWLESPDQCPIAPIPEALLAYLLAKTKPAHPRPLEPRPVPRRGDTEISLLDLVSQTTRKAIEQGVGEGIRNTTGAAIARDLIGCENWLAGAGVQAIDNAQQLLENYFDRCLPPIEARERATIWRSAQGGSPTPSRSINNLEKVLSWIAAGRPESGGQSNDSQIPKVAKQSQEEGATTALLFDVQSAIKNLEGAALTAELAVIAKKHQQPIGVVNKIAEQLVGEAEQLANSQADQETKAAIEWRSAVANAEINIYSVLPSEFAEPIARIAQSIGHNVEPYIHALLFACGAIAHTRTKVCINDEHEQPVSMYGAILGPSGCKKTYIYKTILTKPFKAIQARLNEDFQSKQEQYEAELTEWETADKGSRGTKPKEPYQAVIYATNATIEGLVRKTMGSDSANGVWINDELAGIFNGLGAYKGGTGGGGDSETILECWDGSDSIQLRANETIVPPHPVKFAIFGGIQPGVLRRWAKTGEDDNGNLARFTLSTVKHTPQLLKRNVGANMSPLLIDIYQRIRSFGDLKLELSEDSFNFYNHWQLEAANRAENTEGWEANTLAKASSTLLRCAGALHLLESANQQAKNGQSDVPVPKTIEIETMQRGAIFAQYLTDNTLLYAGESNIRDPDLIRIEKMVKAFEGKGFIDAYKVRANQSAKDKNRVADCRSLMIKAVALGLAIDNGETGSKFQIKIHSGKAGQIGQFAPSKNSSGQNLVKKWSIDQTSENSPNFGGDPPNTHTEDLTKKLTIFDHGLTKS